MKGSVKKGDFLDLLESEREARGFDFKRVSANEAASKQSKKETFTKETRNASNFDDSPAFGESLLRLHLSLSKNLKQ